MIHDYKLRLLERAGELLFEYDKLLEAIQECEKMIEEVDQAREDLKVLKQEIPIESLITQEQMFEKWKSRARQWMDDQKQEKIISIPIDGLSPNTLLTFLCSGATYDNRK